MPKIIKDCKEKILSSAKIELYQNKKDGFSMRRVALGAGVAVGTIYHYYPDKINLIAEILLESWMEKYQRTMDEMKSCKDIKEVVEKISILISEFRKENAEIFSDYRDEGFSDYYVKLHDSFTLQIVNLFRKGMDILGRSLPEEEVRMVAEMILIQERTKAISFTTLVSMISKLI